MGYYEHDGCCGCKYDPLNYDEMPCRMCKGTAVPGHGDEYDDFWTPCEAKPENDVINHPSHYTQGSIECIEAMEAAFGAAELATYCKIAAFKYIWRCELKNGSEDIKKAIWYLNKHLELTERTGNDDTANGAKAENHCLA